MINTLRADNLAKSYKSRPVVQDVSLQLKSSEIVGLLGPNGAGKTTCFYMMAGLIRSDKGRVFINDKSCCWTSYSMVLALACNKGLSGEVLL